MKKIQTIIYQIIGNKQNLPFTKQILAFTKQILAFTKQILAHTKQNLGFIKKIKLNLSIYKIMFRSILKIIIILLLIIFIYSKKIYCDSDDEENITEYRELKNYYNKVTLKFFRFLIFTNSYHTNEFIPEITCFDINYLTNISKLRETIKNWILENDSLEG